MYIYERVMLNSVQNAILKREGQGLETGSKLPHKKMFLVTTFSPPPSPPHPSLNGSAEYNGTVTSTIKIIIITGILLKCCLIFSTTKT